MSWQSLHLARYRARPRDGRSGWRFAPAEAEEAMERRFGVASLEGFGLGGFGPAVGAAGAVLAYVDEVQPGALASLRTPRPLFPDRHLILDETTLANLEVLEPLRDGAPTPRSSASSTGRAPRPAASGTTSR